MKVVARMHKTLIWERTRARQRLRHALREYFPAAVAAFEDLDAGDTLELLAKAPDPASAARLSLSQISAALKRARRRDIPAKAAAIQAVLRAEHLGQPAVVTAAYAASVRALVALLGTLNAQVTTMQGQVEAHFGRHPDAEIILSQPGLGVVLGARVLAEFGDDHDRYTSAKARKNYAATSPITRASGKKAPSRPDSCTTTGSSTPCMTQAFTALRASPGARAYYDQQRARGASTTPPYASSPTASSASCTAASRPAPPTTRPPPGLTTSTRPLLDIQAPGMSLLCTPMCASRGR